jgi:hypothetical protein
VSQDYQMTPSPHSGYSPQYLEKLALQFLRKNNPKNLTSAIQAFTQEIRSSLSSRPSLSPRSDSKLKEPIETAMTTAFKRWQNEKKASPASQPLQNANALETCRLDKLKQAIGQSLFQTVAALRALKHDSRM